MIVPKKVSVYRVSQVTMARSLYSKKRMLVMQPALFLDRDGVINENLKEGLLKWENFRLLPNALEALKLLNDKLPKQIKIILTTNQRYINQGKLSEKDLNNFHEKMKKIIENAGGRIDAIYYCPHTDEDNCECRKPKPGMHLKAAKDFGIDLKKSIYIGDSTRDIRLANNIGEISILLKTGEAGNDKKFVARPDYVARDLLEASKIVLKIFL